MNPTNIYATEGIYTVSLTVTDDSGLVSAPVTTTATINAIVTVDTDNNGIDDTLDNCIDTPNGPLIPDAGGFSQRDTDGDGAVNLTDYSFFRSAFGGSPGPSCCVP